MNRNEQNTSQFISQLFPRGLCTLHVADEYCEGLWWDPEFSRVEPGVGRWWSWGPFGRAGRGRPKGQPGGYPSRGAGPRVTEKLECG